MPNDGSVTSEELASTWRAENESRRLDLQERHHVDQQEGGGGGGGSSGPGLTGSLTKKVGPLPVWGWTLLVAAGGYLLYRWYEARSASGSTTAVGTDITGGGGAGSGGSGGYSGGQGTGTLPTTPSTNPLAGLVQLGGGWWIPQSEQPIQDTQSGNWYSWLSPQAASADPTIQRYIQISPGNFIAVKDGQVLPPGTPQFVASGAPVPGYTY
jgi:hypothetical protein